jgi:hypothetical protein
VARAAERSDSVFDFIYVDHRRLGLYLAQFSEFGNLTNLVRSVKASDNTDLQANLAVVKGSMKSGQETSLQKHYDAQWAAPLTFLEEIQDRGMLKADISSAQIGDLLILPGTLNLVDLQIFARAFETMAGTTPSASTSAQAGQGNRSQRRAAASVNRKQSAVVNQEDSNGFKLLAALDQPLLMLFQTDAERFWSAIDRTFVVGGSAHLHLKYGPTIRGEWDMIGILDCLPSPIIDDGAAIGRFCGGAENSFADAALEMLRELRILMGRPEDCYGITPLILMREIK